MRPSHRAIRPISARAPGSDAGYVGGERIGSRPAQSCPAEVQVAAGSYDVVVSGPGLQPFSKRYTFGVGNNFIELEALATLQNAGTIAFTCDQPGTEITVGFERFRCPATRTFSAGPPVGGHSAG